MNAEIIILRGRDVYFFLESQFPFLLMKTSVLQHTYSNQIGTTSNQIGTMIEPAGEGPPTQQPQEDES